MRNVCSSPVIFVPKLILSHEQQQVQIDPILATISWDNTIEESLAILETWDQLDDMPWK